MSTQTPLPKKNPKKEATIKKRIDDQKKLFLETLEKIPVIAVACKKAGISRSTYYRWKIEDADFEREAHRIYSEGILAINDLAKSKIVELISEKNLSAAIFWLKTHDSEFVEKKKIDIKLQETISKPVDPETIARIKRVMGNYAGVLNKMKGKRNQFDGRTPKEKEKDDDIENDEDEDEINSSE